MLVKLALSGHASPEALSKFERIKAYVPDSAPVLVTYFNKQVLLSDLLVNFSNFLPSLEITKDKDMLVTFRGNETPLVEFIVNLKLYSMKLGKLFFEFENQFKEKEQDFKGFIKRHKLKGFDHANFVNYVKLGAYDSALDIIKHQYESVKKTFFVLFKDRFTLLESKGFI
ncbi:hypothetical protein WCE01_15585 [Acinetobacter indicus]|uniref:hypothetical protein n=1 Tax=Acinetobacter indicus TaxID=756892 RepID=UPI0034D4BF83